MAAILAIICCSMGHKCMYNIKCPYFYLLVLLVVMIACVSPLGAIVYSTNSLGYSSKALSIFSSSELDRWREAKQQSRH